jgi:hypothetical protein
VGKVTEKSNGDETLSDEATLKSNANEALSDNPLKKVNNEKKIIAMKRLTLLKN